MPRVYQYSELVLAEVELNFQNYVKILAYWPKYEYAHFIKNIKNVQIAEKLAEICELFEK